MRIASPLTTLAALALVGACSQPAEDEAGAAAPEGAAALSGESGLATAIGCSAHLGAASRLFSALAEQSNGAERQDLANRAASRGAAADQYQALAHRLAGEIGQSADVTSQAFAQAEAAIESEFNTREFTDFAVWIGEQADQCPPPGMG